MSNRSSVVVVGGGIIGLFTAYYAAEAGHSVTILERGGPDHDGCSLGNAGMIVPSHFIPLAAPGAPALGIRMMFRRDSPFALRPRLDRDLIDWCVKFCRASTAKRVESAAPLLLSLNLASRAAYQELAAEEEAFGLTSRGLLLLCKSDRSLKDEAKLVETSRRLGLAAELLSPEETAAIEPGIRMDIAGAVYFPQDCHLNPGLLMSWLTREVQNRGVSIRWNTIVAGWNRGSSDIESVRTTTGEICADDFVVAAGARSHEILRPLGIRLPMQAGKGYSITVPAPRELPAICSILSEARIAVTPMGQALRFGGTMEVGGNDLSVSQQRVDGMIRSIPAYFPEFRVEDFRGLPVWSGLRPCSPDGLPYIGRFDRCRNLIAATGHAMMGVSLAPVTGKLAAQILRNETPAVDMALLSPDRFVNVRRS